MSTNLVSWYSPALNITLNKHEVHLWCLSLERSKENIQDLLQILSPGERMRANRFGFDKDRDNFIVARGLLRQILSRYLELEPSNINFHYNQYGKPEINIDGYNLCFNISYSHELILIGVSQNRLIGVDLEYIYNDFPCGQVAETLFSPHEYSALLKLPENLQHQAFFNCWTRKEAYVKATGRGFSIPLDQFNVSFIPGEVAMLLNTRWDIKEASRWCLKEFIPCSGYVGALAVEGNDWELRILNFQG
jgi:4'-phosphopantetheinyl transferase